MIHLSVVLDCGDPESLAEFWTAALHYRRVASEDQYVGLRDPEGRLPTLVLQRVPEPKTAKNRMHLDVFSDRLDEDLDRLERLGATVVTPEDVEPDGRRIIVLADPEGNEFCLLDLEPPAVEGSTASPH